MSVNRSHLHTDFRRRLELLPREVLISLTLSSSLFSSFTHLFLVLLLKILHIDSISALVYLFPFPCFCVQFPVWLEITPHLLLRWCKFNVKSSVDSNQEDDFFIKSELFLHSLLGLKRLFLRRQWQVLQTQRMISLSGQLLKRKRRLSDASDHFILPVA